jgi:carboxyl-terminal processing protease
MIKKLVSSLCLVSSLAMVPAASTAFAAVDVETYRQMDLLITIMQQVKATYVEPVDDATLLRAAIAGMVTSLDEDSSYLGPDEYGRLVQDGGMTGAGVGLNFEIEDGLIKVVGANGHSPAEQAGIKPGDYISHVDGQLLYGVTRAEAFAKLQGTPGTSVKVTIVRPGRDAPFDATLVRQASRPNSVTWTMKNGVAVIDLDIFDNQAAAGVRSALAQIKAREKPLGYVLDLRSNPGGILDQAIEVSDLFLDKGEIVSQRGRGKADVQRYMAKSGDDAGGLPVVVLIDAGTVAGAEIVAAALQDNHRALVMGQRSYGRGSIQTLLPLSANSAMRLTTSRFYTPAGKQVQGKGIAPDLAVPQLSDPDFKARPFLRENALRQHLINEVAVDQQVVEDDAGPDPRFAATPEDLKRKGISDFQLDYALRTIARLGGAPAAGAAAGGGK